MSHMNTELLRDITDFLSERLKEGRLDETVRLELLAGGSKKSSQHFMSSFSGVSVASDTWQSSLGSRPGICMRCASDTAYGRRICERGEDTAGTGLKPAPALAVELRCPL